MIFSLSKQDKMKDKLLSTLIELENKKLADFHYSLTVNYINIIQNFECKKFDLHNIRKIINDCEHIDTYNLTIINYGRYDEERHKKYYFSVDLIFHSDGIVFNFVSPYLSNRELEFSNIDNLFKVYEEHKLCSEKLYNIVKNSIFHIDS
jgi:hypothetical protein